MRAAVAVAQSAEDPLAGLALVEDHPRPAPRPGWTRIRVHAASLNPHDVWTLRGVGHPAERIPIVLGCDASGVTEDGREVVVHPVSGDPSRGDVTLDPRRAILSETFDGGLADELIVPDEMLVDKPAEISHVDAAALGIVWGTAYRMLFTRAGLAPGHRVLVQGGAGGVGSASIALARAAGAVVYATARTAEKREFAAAQGAHVALEPGARLPERVDVVIDTVGEATWAHSMRSVRPGGVIATCGATTGGMPPAELQRVFYQQLSIVGSTGCTLAEFEAMLRMVTATGLRPATETLAFDEVPAGYARLDAGDVRGKLVVDFTR
ncbi:zinc-binding dehydrogenase [Microbacterium sp. ZXX196]|uniref:zinc-binding dehydrogenase n=1 Tax=Microbacterium sp. ZXX196 TaxID=2609291 RepID=UPI0012B9E5BA|nr:zinc-binding dehydrogenase [Microbacterium sp. ZXX196]MTE24523.1 zinc-binding dehydrogenase [Microbacterium sp. ZXX196]